MRPLPKGFVPSKKQVRMRQLASRPNNTLFTGRNLALVAGCSILVMCIFGFSDFPKNHRCLYSIPEGKKEISIEREKLVAEPESESRQESIRRLIRLSEIRTHVKNALLPKIIEQSQSRSSWCNWLCGRSQEDSDPIEIQLKNAMKPIDEEIRNALAAHKTALEKQQGKRKLKNEYLVRTDKKNWDKDASECQVCGAEFIGRLWRRTHHCRTCGKAICNRPSCYSFEIFKVYSTTCASEPENKATTLCKECPGLKTREVPPKNNKLPEYNVNSSNRFASSTD